MSVRHGVAALVLAAMAGALGACAGPASQPPPWRIGEADAGRSIRVPVGTVVDVALPGNPSTGFTWERGQTESQLAGLDALGPARFAPEGPLVGQGGLMHLEFRVTGTGAMPLVLVYHRPFEKGVPPARTFWVTIVGEPD